MTWKQKKACFSALVSETKASPSFSRETGQMFLFFAGLSAAIWCVCLVFTSEDFYSWLVAVIELALVLFMIGIAIAALPVSILLFYGFKIFILSDDIYERTYISKPDQTPLVVLLWLSLCALAYWSIF